MARIPNRIHVLNVLAAIAIVATIVAICLHSGKANLDFEEKLTLEPLPPWTPDGVRRNSTERMQIDKWQTSIALLTTQFTNYMSEHSVVVNLRRCHYDIRLDSYDLEYDWQLSVNPEAGTDKITLVRMSGDRKYAVDAKPVATSDSTIAEKIAREFTATLPGD